MTTPLQSLVACGTKLWLDSIDPDEVARNLVFGATGATSNPIIVAGLIETGRFDQELAQFIRSGFDDDTIAWKLTDALVRRAQASFEPAWTRTGGGPPRCPVGFSRNIPGPPSRVSRISAWSSC